LEINVVPNRTPEVRGVSVGGGSEECQEATQAGQDQSPQSQEGSLLRPGHCSCTGWFRRNHARYSTANFAIRQAPDTDTLEQVYKPDLGREGNLNGAWQDRVATDLSYKKQNLRLAKGNQARFL
jgi:hypothetical protein